MLTAADELYHVSRSAIREVIKYAEARFYLGPGNDTDHGKDLRLQSRVDTAVAIAAAKRGGSSRFTTQPFSARGNLRHRDWYVGTVTGL